MSGNQKTTESCVKFTLYSNFGAVAAQPHLIIYKSKYRVLRSNVLREDIRDLKQIDPDFFMSWKGPLPNLVPHECRNKPCSRGINSFSSLYAPMVSHVQIVLGSRQVSVLLCHLLPELVTCSPMFQSGSIPSSILSGTPDAPSILAA